MKRDDLAGRPSTTVVYRPDGAIAGVRLYQDDAARIAVLALPIAEIRNLASQRDLLGPGRSLDAACAYVWADRSQVYIGETQGIVARLKDHARRHEMAWGAEAFVAATFDTYLDKPAVLHMQRAFSDAAKRAGLMHVVEGARPPAQLLSPARAAAINRMIANAYPLFFDAGLRAFHSGNPPGLDQLGLVRGTAEGGDSGDDFDMTIGAPIGPDVKAECQLSYANVWAHGYACGGDWFVLGVGSEIRAATNPSAYQVYADRRMELIRGGALVPIVGTTDRLRLVTTVGVNSSTVAARLACGAQVTSGLWKMRPVRQTP